MLHALMAQGVKADFVVGSSVGAINGAYFAGDPTAGGVTRLEKLWLGIRRNDVFPVNFRTAAGFLWRRDFLMRPAGLRQLIDTHLPYRLLEEARIPVYVVATNLLSGDAVVLSRGTAADAIVASSAIPAAFPPVAIVDGHYLVDGAITSNTPGQGGGGARSAAADRAADRVLPAAANPADGSRRQRPSCLDPADCAPTRRGAGGAGRGHRFAIVPTLCPLAGSPYDFSRSAELIASAAESTRQWIAGGGRLLLSRLK